VDSYAVYVWIALAVAAVGLYLSWTAGRLDRLHTRVDATRAALDATLLRRASVVQELATSGVLDPAASIVLQDAAYAARQAEPDEREVAESELSQALRAVLAEPDAIAAVRAAPGGERAAGELAQAVRRVPMARRFHNDAVGAARALRRHRKVRWFRLAGHAPRPAAFEMDDEPPPLLAAGADLALDPAPRPAPHPGVGPRSPHGTRDPRRPGDSPADGPGGPDAQATDV
jgi:hypothetical protein